MTQAARWAVLGSLFLIPFLPLFVAQGAANSFSEAHGFLANLLVLVIVLIRIPFQFLIGFSDLFFPFITGKNFAFRILVEVAVCGYAVLALAHKAYRPRFSWTLVLYGALVVWMIIADALAVNPHKAFWSNFERMDGWVTLVHVFALFVVAGAVLAKDKLFRAWWLTFVGASALVSLYALFQLFGWLAIHQGGRIDATVGNAAYLASYFLFAGAVAVWQGIESPKRLRWCLFALAALDAFLVVAGATRGAVLGLVAGAAVAAFLWMLESGGRARRAAAGALLAVVVLAGGFYLARDSAFIQQSPQLSRVASISFADLQVRFRIWTMAFHGFAERPVAGWGQEGFNYVFNTYYEPEMYGQEAWFDRAHNTFLDWLIAGGIPALLLFLALLASAVLALYRRGATRPERILLLAALAAYAVQALVVFDNLLTYVSLAMILAVAHAVSARPWKKLDEAPEVPEASVNAVVAPVAAVALIALVWFVNVPGIRAGGDLIKALSPAGGIENNIALFQKALADGSFASQEIREQAVQVAQSVSGNAAAPDDDRAAITAFALDQMRQQVAQAPLDARLRLQLAVAYRAAGDLENARVQSAAAHALSPKKQGILIEQGTAALSAGDFKGARAAFDAAYQLDTSYSDLAAYAAAGALLDGDRQGADALLLGSFGTTTVDNPVLLYAYYHTGRFDDLVAIWKQRVAAQDGSPSARFGLASVYAAAGRSAAARAEIEDTIAAHPEAKAQGEQLLAQLDALQ